MLCQVRCRGVLVALSMSNGRLALWSPAPSSLLYLKPSSNMSQMVICHTHQSHRDSDGGAESDSSRTVSRQSSIRGTNWSVSFPHYLSRPAGWGVISSRGRVSFTVELRKSNVCCGCGCSCEKKVQFHIRQGFSDTHRHIFSILPYLVT